MNTNSRPPRIALGAMFNETSHFLTTTADLDHWRNTYVLEGAEIFSLRGATCEEAGALMVFDAAGVDIVPLLAARSVSSGPSTEATYHALKDGILAPLRRSLPVDGVMLAMHGSMTTVTEDDPEGDVLAAVREIVGPNVPIVSTLDLHANVTRRMVENADALVAFTRYPHDDTFTTGERGARLLLDLVAGRARAAMALAKVPVLCSGVRGMTFGDAPMAHLTRRARALEAEPGILSVSVFQVHPTNDLPGLGSGALVVTDGDPARAEREAAAIALELWQRRHAFEPEMFAVDEAVQRGLAIAGGPVLLVDTADCVGGGAAGDSVALLQRLLELRVDAATYLMVVDPEAARHCAAAGIGRTVSLSLGYKLDPSWGKPLPVTGVVRHLLDGDFTFTGGAYGGYGRPDGSVGGARDRADRGAHHVAPNLRLGRRAVPRGRPGCALCEIHWRKEPDELQFRLSRDQQGIVGARHSRADSGNHPRPAVPANATAVSSRWTRYSRA